MLHFKTPDKYVRNVTTTHWLKLKKQLLQIKDDTLKENSPKYLKKLNQNIKINTFVLTPTKHKQIFQAKPRINI